MSDGEQRAHWRKSSYSNTGNCLEWLMDAETVRLRDSRGRSSDEVRVSHSQWRAFLAAVKADESDPPHTA